MRHHSLSPASTRALAAALAARLKRAPHHRHATVLALRGDLGSGKTTFTQAFLRAFGVRGRVTSPTFVLMQRYGLRHAWFKRAYHIDGYRLKRAADFRGIGLDELVRDPHAILLLEWPARARSLFPKKTINVAFAHGRTEQERHITL